MRKTAYNKVGVKYLKLTFELKVIKKIIYKASKGSPGGSACMFKCMAKAAITPPATCLFLLGTCSVCVYQGAA